MPDSPSQPAGTPRWSVRPGVAADAGSFAAVKAAASATAADRAEGTPRVGAPEIGPFAQLLGERSGLVHVAEARGAIVGFLVLQPAAHPAVAARCPVQLWQLYVIPPFQGSGVAAELVSSGLGHARARQHDVIWLGVSPDNLRAMAFYRKEGFETLGVHEVGGASPAHRDLIMARPVRSGVGGVR